MNDSTAIPEANNGELEERQKMLSLSDLLPADLKSCDMQVVFGLLVTAYLNLPIQSVSSFVDWADQQAVAKLMVEKGYLEPRIHTNYDSTNRPHSHTIGYVARPKAASFYRAVCDALGHYPGGIKP